MDVRGPWPCGTSARYGVHVSCDVPNNSLANAADGAKPARPAFSTRMASMLRRLSLRRRGLVDDHGMSPQDDMVYSRQEFLLQHRQLLADLFREALKSADGGRDQFAIPVLIEAALYDVEYWENLWQAGYHKVAFEQTGGKSAAPSLCGTWIGGSNDGGPKVLIGHPASIEDLARAHGVSTGEVMRRVLSSPQDEMPEPGTTQGFWKGAISFDRQGPHAD
jgi:hypothetical protein